MRLPEDAAKAALAELGLLVPMGRAGGRNQDISDIARQLLAEAGSPTSDATTTVVVKALIPAGRRGRSGLVKRCAWNDAQAVASLMFGQQMAGYTVDKVYVEQAVDIASEYYLGFTFAGDSLRVMVSKHGGIDIEHTAHERPDAVVSRVIDPLLGLRSWDAIALWDAAGIPFDQLAAVASLTVRLFNAFVKCDAQMLEINPLVTTRTGETYVVGAMMEIDDNALHRHPEWEIAAEESSGPGGRPLTSGERAVSAANRQYPGGATRYIELDGEIGLLVSGGGAGLYQHDIILGLGARPANHTDFSPTPTPDKQVAILDAILGKPGVKGLLISCNYLQLARCDIIVEALVLSLLRNHVDTRRFPIVIRLFGPKEEEARAMVTNLPGVDYLPRGTSLAQACAAIVRATAHL